ncbi:cytochrome P450 [Suillus hirtellus]|nr:cytochrome P450 [Suillus hirtellus]
MIPENSIMNVNISYTASIIATVVVFAKLYQKSSLASGKNSIMLPPGPPAHWFWSNTLPTVNIAHVLTDLVQEYGPIVSLRQGNQVIVVIGSIEAATDIMEKEGGSLVDRPGSIAVGEMLSEGMRILMARSGDHFWRLRKAVHTHLQLKVAETYQDMQRENAMIFVLDMLNDPKNPQKHAQRFAASVILWVTYGKSVPTANTDPEVVCIHRVMEHFQVAMRPGAYLVDCWHHEELELYKHQLQHDQNTAGPSFTKTLLEHANEYNFPQMKWHILLDHSLGQDLIRQTAVAMTVAIMAAACYPAAQAKVHEELNMVIGSDRVPTFEDSSSLPQLHTFLLESLRWRPVIRIGFPHCATKDIFWISKDTAFLRVQ